MTDHKTNEAAEEQFTRFLRSRRLRKTSERYAILKKVSKMPRHFSSEDLSEALDAEGYHVSLTTVYATLELLCQCGILLRHIFGRHAQYEVSGQNHCHLVCTQCGKVREVNDDELTRLLTSRRFSRFTPAYFSTSIYGCCSTCARKQKKETQKRQRSKTSN